MCDQCGNQPCTCQKKAQTPKTLWLLQTCQAPGCAVVIRSHPDRPLLSPRCQWHNQGRAYNSAQIKHTPGEGALLSRDEFGQDLFEAIAVQAEIRQCYRNAQIERGKTRPAKAEAHEVRAVELQHHLETILKKNTISGPDLKRLLAIT